MPLIFHYGIICNVDGCQKIIHNPQNGSPVIESFDDFFKDRYFEKSFGIQTQKTNVQILECYDKIKHKKFDLFLFNCEDCMNTIIGKNEFGSGKLTVMILIAVSFYFLLKYFKK